MPPHDVEAERALLSAAMLDQAAAEQAAAVPTDAWWHPAHQAIAGAVAALVAAGDPTDAVTVADRLARDGLLDRVGGHEGLVDLAAAGGAPSAARHYAGIITRHARLRRIIAAATEAAEAAWRHDETAALAHLEAVLDDQPNAADATTSIGDLLDDHLDLLEARGSGGTHTIPTGLAALDEIIAGLHPGELHVVAARPGVGKTALGGQIALHVADAGVPVLFASLEMSRVELTDRWLANLGHVDTTRMQRGTMTDADWHRIGVATGRLARLPITVLDDPVVTVPQIRAAARACGARLVVVDYLQLVTPTTPAGRQVNRQEEVAQVARGLKVLARTLDVAVLALAQLNRAVEARWDKRPTLADLRDSGEIEAAAGVVIGLYRPYVHDQAAHHPAETELIVLKNRHGATGTAAARFEGYRQGIEDVTS